MSPFKSRAMSRKLTGGEICNPFEDVVHEVPPACRVSASATRYGRAVFSSSPTIRSSGQTIAWGDLGQRGLPEQS